jgi:hypothetical protein
LTKGFVVDMTKGFVVECPRSPAPEGVGLLLLIDPFFIFLLTPPESDVRLIQAPEG